VIVLNCVIKEMCYNRYNAYIFLLTFINCFIIIITNENRDIENDWNVTQWWAENQDFDHKKSNLKFANIRQQSLVFAFAPGKETRPDYYIPSENSGDTNTTDLIDSLETYDTSNLIIPRSSTQSLLNTFYDYFTQIRSYRGDRYNYRKVKRNLRDQFLKLGLNTALQSFWPPEVSQYRSNEKAHNIIGIWPGSYRGTSRDQIIIIGAHFDTVKTSPGVDDNGSGCTAVLEIAKLVTQNNCKLDKTLMFVLFDMEEDGLKGSKHFVKDYLIPIEVNKNGAKVVGAIIMDMILEHDMSRNSQSLGPIATALPDWSLSVKQNGYKGDFAAVWARKGVDNHLYQTLKRNWISKSKYKLSLMDPLLPRLGSQMDVKYGKYSKYNTFVRSDHASFWYPTERDITFNAILITDLGPWRKNMKFNYHKSSDDTRIINQNNLLFLKNTVDSITSTILELANGKCFK
jgi:hypothetical protein